MLTGGVAYNKAIVKALKDVLKLKDEEVIIPDDCGNMGALGAAMIGLKEGIPLDLSILKTIIVENESKLNVVENSIIFPSLKGYGNNDSANKHDCKEVDSQSSISGYIGLDVGSTSTNVVLMAPDQSVIAFQYLRTLGNPIEAVRKGLLEIKKVDM